MTNFIKIRKITLVRKRIVVSGCLKIVEDEVIKGKSGEEEGCQWKTVKKEVMETL